MCYKCYEEFVLDDGCFLNVIHRQLPGYGGGKTGIRTQKELDLVTWLRTKKSIINPPKGSDSIHFCAAKCLAIAVKRQKEGGRLSVQKLNKPLLTADAKHLHQECNVPFGKCSIQDISKFQKSKLLKGYQIMVYDTVAGLNMVYKGMPECSPEFQIHLLLHCDHYYLVTSLKALFAYKQFYNDCKEQYR